MQVKNLAFKWHYDLFVQSMLGSFLHQLELCLWVQEFAFQLQRNANEEYFIAFNTCPWVCKNALLYLSTNPSGCGHYFSSVQRAACLR